MKIQGRLLQTYAWPYFIVVHWEPDFLRVKCTGFDRLGRFTVIHVTPEEFGTSKPQTFEIASVESPGG